MKDDFDKLYSKGDIIYYVHEDVLNKKEIKQLKVSTIYPKILIAFEDRGMAQCIDYKDRDKIFADEYGARRYLEGEDES